MQPTFLPWLGCFDMIDQADRFVFLDHVQLAKRSWQVRNRIKLNGVEHFIGVPVRKSKTRDALMLNEARIDYTSRWPEKMITTLTHAYRGSPCFDEVLAWFGSHLEARPEHLSSLTVSLIRSACDGVGISTPTVLSSDMEVSGHKDQLLVDICRRVDCTEYLSARGSQAYIDAENPGGAFAKAGIALSYHAYDHPSYPQGKGPFMPYLGIIDLLFNTGFGGALEIIRTGRRPAESGGEEGA